MYAPGNDRGPCMGVHESISGLAVASGQEAIEGEGPGKWQGSGETLCDRSPSQGYLYSRRE